MHGGGGGGGGRDASFEREVAQDLWAWGGEVGVEVVRKAVVHVRMRMCMCIAHMHSKHMQRTCSIGTVYTVCAGSACDETEVMSSSAHLPSGEGLTLSVS